VTCMSLIMSIISRIKQDDRPEVTPLLYRKWTLPGCLQMHCNGDRQQLTKIRADELHSLQSQFARSIPRFLKFKDTCSSNFGYATF